MKFIQRNHYLEQIISVMGTPDIMRTQAAHFAFEL